MEFEQLEAEAQNLTTDNEKLAQVLRASVLEDDDNLDAIEDSEILGTDEEEGDEDEDEEEEEGLQDEQAAAAAMEHLGTMQSYPPLPSGDYEHLQHDRSTMYGEPIYHMVAPSPDVSVLHDGTTTSVSVPRVDIVEIRRALALNLQYRETLKQQLKNIEEARARNAEYQRKIKALIVQSQKKTARKPGKRSFTAPYFATVGGEVPPDNRDTIKRRDYLKRMPTGFKCKKWNQSEENALASGVRTMNQGILWSQMMERSQARTSEELQREREAIKRIPPDQLEINLEGLDWEVLAKVHVPTRSAMDCKIHWTQVMHPDVNKKKFTKEEDQRLLALANEHKGHNWQAIAERLGTNRTAAQCMQRYQRSLNTNIMRGKWTKQEDKELIEAVRLCGNKNWQQVAHCLKDRTGQQCLHRWQKTLNPDIRRGRWSPLEDMMLTLAVKAYSENLSWVKVQTQVPGRTDVQCRERWVNILNPALNVGPWTEEEDEKLRRHVEAHGAGKWSEIAKLLHPRTDNQCWRRWKSINSGPELANYRRTVHKKKKALVNNFVGREKERSDLTIGDFVGDDDEQAELEQQPRQEPQAKPPSPTPDSMRSLSPVPLSLPLSLLTGVDASVLPTFTQERPRSPDIVILPMEEPTPQGTADDDDDDGEQGENSNSTASTAAATRRKDSASTRGRKRKAVTRKATASPEKETAKKGKKASASPKTKKTTTTTTKEKAPAKRGRKRKASDETSDGDFAAAAAAAPRKRGRARQSAAAPAEPASTQDGASETTPSAAGVGGEEQPKCDGAAAEPVATRRSARVPKKRKTYEDN